MQSPQRHIFPFKHAPILKLLIFNLFLLFILFAVGCGRVDVDLHTTIKPTGDVVQEITMTGSGLMATYIGTSEFVNNARGAGWQTNVTQSSGTTTLIASKTFSKGEPLDIPVFSGVTKDSNKPVFKGTNYFIMREYAFETQYPGNPNMKFDNSQSAALSEAMINSMLGFSWTCTLPGDIIETNADSTSGSSATWRFDYSALKNGRTMTMKSRYIDWLVIGIIIGVIALMTILTIVLKRKKTVTNTESYAFNAGQSTQVLRCNNCGYLNSYGQQFCGNCRSTLFNPNPPIYNSQQPFRCPNCNNYINYGSTSCPYCGGWLRW